MCSDLQQPFWVGANQRRAAAVPAKCLSRERPLRAASASMSSEMPLCTAIEHALQQLCEMIEEGKGAVYRVGAEQRLCFVRIVNTLPVCSRALWDEARKHEGFEPLLYYERVRAGFVSQHYFLDGLPARVQLFAGPTSVGLPEDQVRKIKLRDVLADRARSVSKLEGMTAGSPRRAELIRSHHPSDLGDGVPGAPDRRATTPLPRPSPAHARVHHFLLLVCARTGPVRVFIARCRAVVRAVRRVKRAQLFVQCHNCNCNRLFYTGEAVEAWVAAVQGEMACDPARDSDVEEEHSSARYWSIAGGKLPSAVPPSRRFCSEMCKREHCAHLASMMPDAGICLDADDSAKRSGRARVGEAFCMALKRNENAARALRLAKSRPRQHLAVSQREAEEYRTQLITALNVDLGLLYASKLVAESATLSKGKVLPGSVMYWRDDPSYYAKPLAEMTKMYARAARKEGIVSSMLTTPRFLEVVAARVNRIF